MQQILVARRLSAGTVGQQKQTRSQSSASVRGLVKHVAEGTKAVHDTHDARGQRGMFSCSIVQSSHTDRHTRAHANEDKNAREHAHTCARAH